MPVTPSSDTNSSERNINSSRPFLLVVVFLSLWLVYRLLAPFSDTVIFAIVLASLFYPLTKYVMTKCRKSRNITAAVMVTVITVVILIPMLFVGTSLVTQGAELTGEVRAWLAQGNLDRLEEHPQVVAVGTWVSETLQMAGLENIDYKDGLLKVSRNLSEFLVSNGAFLIGNVATFLTHFGIMLFILFFLTRDGDRMVLAMRRLVPLSDEQEDTIINSIRSVTRSVVMGTFLTAICQGTIGGLGMAIVGIPGIFWGTMMAFASMIPIVGTSLVWIPATSYLLIIGQWQNALILAAWSIILVGSIDQFLRPVFMKGKGGLSPFYIFLGIIGGVQLYGLAGILYGPLIFAFAKVMLIIYEIEFAAFLHSEYQPEPVNPPVDQASV